MTPDTIPLICGGISSQPTTKTRVCPVIDIPSKNKRINIDIADKPGTKITMLLTMADKKADKNMSRVAEAVELERTHLYRKLKQLGIKTK
jgi:transcriptional regulator of acetoin/glycerol metabolism